jgi:ABC-type uncharacterized transport system permease subunit
VLFLAAALLFAMTFRRQHRRGGWFRQRLREKYRAL